MTNEEMLNQILDMIHKIENTQHKIIEMINSLDAVIIYGGEEPTQEDDSFNINLN